MLISQDIYDLFNHIVCHLEVISGTGEMMNKQVSIKSETKHISASTDPNVIVTD